jgi:hypothetical protein
LHPYKRGVVPRTSHMKKKPKIPRQYSLVRFCFDQMPVKSHTSYPFTEKGVYVFFGDIPNMPGHCVVADHKTGQIYSGYHTENFVEIPGDE